MSWCVVIPSNRPDQLDEWKAAWKELFEIHDVQLVVVEDNEDGWRQIPDFIPRQTDMIRSWGMYKAYQLDTDYILTLDDDTRPITDVFAAYEAEFKIGRPLSEYFSVGSLTDSGVEMRGFPYKGRALQDVAVQYGGWDGVMDFDAATQLAIPPQDNGKFARVSVQVPKGIPTTCCIMNTAWKREYTPIMWQLPMLDGRYNRFGDIWSGLFIKKYLDANEGVMVINGKASIRHERASNPFNNMKREAPGLEINEGLWDALKGESYTEITDSAAAYFEQFDPEYAKHFIESRNQWLKLFSDQ